VSARVDSLETRIERMIEPLAARLALLESRMATMHHTHAAAPASRYL
jgi:hypothetical protein